MKFSDEEKIRYPIRLDAKAILLSNSLSPLESYIGTSRKRETFCAFGSMRAMDLLPCDRMLRLCSLVLTLISLMSSAAHSEPDVLLEYCEDATFRAKCPDDHVVMIQEARYGRMRTGQCLSVNYGSIGCSSDVLHVMDRYCSGRRSCSVNVRDLVVEGKKPCPKDLRSYLEARYTCLPVVGTKSECCSSSAQASIRDSHGHIASIVTEESGCGSIDCPWMIEVPKGQRVNISLYEFALPTEEEMKTVRERMPPFSKVCHVYAIIKEKALGSALTLCAGEERQRPLYTSSTNSVEIRVFTKKRLEREAYFVLKYDAIGCPDPKTPSHGWVKRTGNKVEIGCGDPEKVWQLTCHNNRWLGEAGNCSDVLDGYNVAGVLDNILSLSPDLSIVVIILVAMAIAFIILVVGIFCLRRRKWMKTSRRPRGPEASPPHRADIGDVNKNNTLLHPAINGGHNYFRTWELQRHNGGRQQPPLPPPESGTMASEGMGRPRVTSEADDYGVRYVEHVYESPTFHRKDFTEGDDPAQYYELDPEAEVFTPGQNVPMGERNNTIPGSGAVSQRCSYPGTNAHAQNFNPAGNYTS